MFRNEKLFKKHYSKNYYNKRKSQELKEKKEITVFN